MAYKQLILLNNAPITTEKGELIYEVNDNGRVTYQTMRDITDHSDLVKDATEKVLSFDQQNPLFPASEHTNTIFTEVNSNFRLKLISTPLYNLQKQLSLAKSREMRIPGLNLDLGGLWEQQKLRFLTAEFYKYIKLLTYLENTMNKSLNKPSDPSLAIKREDKQVMHLVHAKVDYLYNPYDAFSFLSETKLFQSVYKQDYTPQPVSLQEASVFSSVAVRQSTEVTLGTSCDILELCGVQLKHQLKTRDLHRLMAGICLRALGASDSVEVTEESLYFPISRRFYQVYDVVDEIVVDRYFDVVEANRRADLDDLLVTTVDTDVAFVNQVFGSEDPTIVDAIRGADFV